MFDILNIYVWLYDFSIQWDFILQIIILYVFLLLLKSDNVYYSLLYLFLELVFLGIFISYYQMELFTGFLWVAEFTVVMVFIILVVYLNGTGFIKNSISFKHYSFLFLFLYLISFLFYNSPKSYFFFDYVYLWDDFYESIRNNNMNDFSTLFISYYNINSVEFILFAFLLFFGTLVCIALFKNLNNVKISSYGNLLSFFNFFKLKIQYNFLRQQNLHKQTMSVPSNRIIKKK